MNNFIKRLLLSLSLFSLGGQFTGLCAAGTETMMTSNLNTERIFMGALLMAPAVLNIGVLVASEIKWIS